MCMGDWSFLTNHARALLFIAHDPEARLRDVAVALGVTERTAYGIVADLTDAGYVVKEKEGRRNRYDIQTHLPLPDPITGERTIGEVLDLLVDARRQEGRSRRAGDRKKRAAPP
jgi:DNA-binding transcriptional ArsR family regulator